MGVIMNADVFTVMIIIIQRKPEVCVMQSLSFNFRMSYVQNRTRFAKHLCKILHTMSLRPRQALVPAYSMWNCDHVHRFDKLK